VNVVLNKYKTGAREREPNEVIWLLSSVAYIAGLALSYKLCVHSVCQESVMIMGS